MCVRRKHCREYIHERLAGSYDLIYYELCYAVDLAGTLEPDYSPVIFRVLKNKEVRQYRESRARRLVLAAWDRMEANGEFRELGL